METDRADLVLSRLYISSLRIAENQNILNRLHVTHVLTVCPVRPPHYEGITYKLVSISDSPDHRIDLKFQESFEFIRNALVNGGVVLVHCFQGVSRSASIIIGYLITYNSMNFEQAYDYLKHKRACVNPNYGFMNQLRNYAKRLNKPSN